MVGEILDLEVSVPGSARRSDRWTLGLDLPLTVRDGPGDLIAVTVEVDGRPWRLGAED